MSPVQRVDYSAVEDEPAPGAQQRRRADPVGISPEHHVAQRQHERGQQQRHPQQQAERALLGEHAHERGVARDGGVEFELPRADADRVRPAKLPAEVLRGESLRVVGLRVSALFEEVHRAARAQDDQR